jgi:tRNA pseudouridine55 synthase
MKNIEINKISEDEFGRKYGVILLNKPTGITSHDLVYDVRRKFQIKQVGHGGTLDPFASGLMIMLIGKATKLSDSFLGMDKEYIAHAVFGLTSDSGDPDDEITDDAIQKFKSLNKDDIFNILKDKLEITLEKFKPSYKQFVPIFSSIKIKGKKLRELARSTDKFEILDVDNGIKTIEFFRNGTSVFKDELPFKEVQIFNIEIISIEDIAVESYTNRYTEKSIQKLIEQGITTLPIAKIKVRCSKGTYIRQLAIDIGKAIGIDSMLMGLERTGIGEYTLKDIYLD